MAYRRDLDALEARHAALDAEVAAKRRERDQVGEMLHDAHEKERAAIVQADIDAGGPEWRRRRVIHIVIGVLAVVVLGLGLVRLFVIRSPAKAGSALSTFEQLTDEICACKTSSCAADVNDRINKEPSIRGFTAKSARQSARFEALVERSAACHAQLNR